MKSLLEQFVSEEGSPHVRMLIAEAVSRHEREPTEIQKRFEFNRFEITLDVADKSVFIEDVLDPGGSGELRVGLDEFLRELGSPDAATR